MAWDREKKGEMGLGNRSVMAIIAEKLPHSAKEAHGARSNGILLGHSPSGS